MSNRGKSILGIFHRIDDVLRAHAMPRQPAGTSSNILQLSGILLIAGLSYGAVMGSFGGVGFSHLPQMIDSAVKTPLLLLATFGISLPSFFVINTLLGLRSDFGLALRALGSAQAVLTLILFSFAPLTALWYVSMRDYQNAILFNAAMFAIASITAQIVLRKFYRTLIASNPRHRWMLRAWLVTYVFVGIQMGWVLRPFVGNPMLPTRFFRPDALTNAYEFVFHLIWSRF